jgi:hypothetical protein
VECIDDLLGNSTAIAHLVAIGTSPFANSSEIRRAVPTRSLASTATGAPSPAATVGPAGPRDQLLKLILHLFGVVLADVDLIDEFVDPEPNGFLGFDILLVMMEITGLEYQNLLRQLPAPREMG